MATPNYGYEKRQKELAKKRKKEEKLKRKAELKSGVAVEGEEPQEEGSEGTAAEPQPAAPGSSNPAQP